MAGGSTSHLLAQYISPLSFPKQLIEVTFPQLSISTGESGTLGRWLVVTQ